MPAPGGLALAAAHRMVDGIHGHAANKQTPEPTPRAPEVQTLTEREEQVLALLAKGYAYKEISDLMHISFETVRTHVRSIYEKLHVHSRTAATLKYLGR